MKYLPFKLLGGYLLDRHRRIARGEAKLEHAEEALDYIQSPDGASLWGDGWESEAEFMREELDELRPYWGDGRMKMEAVRAHRADLHAMYLAASLGDEDEGGPSRLAEP
jgi:hypothetical protein